MQKLFLDKQLNTNDKETAVLAILNSQFVYLLLLTIFTTHRLYLYETNIFLYLNIFVKMNIIEKNIL